MKPALNKLKKRIHPDLFRDNPAEVWQANDTTLQTVNHFFDSVRSVLGAGQPADRPPRFDRAYQFTFYIRHGSRNSNEIMGGVRRVVVSVRTPSAMLGPVQWAAKDKKLTAHRFASRVLGDLLARAGLYEDAKAVSEATPRADSGDVMAELAGLGTRDALDEAVRWRSEHRGADGPRGAGAGTTAGGAASSGEKGARDGAGSRYVRMRAGQAGRAAPEAPEGMGGQMAESFVAAASVDGMQRLAAETAGGLMALDLRERALRGDAPHDLRLGLTEHALAREAALEKASRRQVVASVFERHRVRIAEGIDADLKRSCIRALHRHMIDNFHAWHLEKPEVWSRCTLLLGRRLHLDREHAILTVPYNLPLKEAAAVAHQALLDAAFPEHSLPAGGHELDPRGPKHESTETLVRRMHRFDQAVGAGGTVAGDAGDASRGFQRGSAFAHGDRTKWSKRFEARSQRRGRPAE